MLGTFLSVGACIAVAIGVVAFLRLRHTGRRRLAVRTPVPASEARSAINLFGLAPADADRLQQSARTQLQRDQAQWGRDYL